MKNLLYIFLIFLMSYWENEEEVCHEDEIILSAFDEYSKMNA